MNKVTINDIVLTHNTCAISSIHINLLTASNS